MPCPNEASKLLPVSASHCRSAPTSHTIGKWLRKLRMTRLQPRPVHPKKDPAAEQAFEKTSVLC